MPYIRNYKYESQSQHLVILTCEPPIKRNSSTAANKYVIFVSSFVSLQSVGFSRLFLRNN